MSESIVAQAKKDVAAKQAANKPKGNPWYVNMIAWIFDSLSVVIILALAVIGALSLIEAGIDNEIKLGIALVVVGLLASRLLDRIFKR